MVLSPTKEVECFLVDKKGSIKGKIPKNLINVVEKELAKIEENSKVKFKISNCWWAGLKSFPQVSIQWTSSTTNISSLFSRLKASRQLWKLSVITASGLINKTWY